LTRPLLSVEGLEKRFLNRVAVTGLTFSVEPGEVFGLLGPNGAGKTTTVRMLTGLLQPSFGSAQVCGEAVPVVGDGSALRSKVGLLTEQPGLYDRLTAEENLVVFAQLYELHVSSAMARAAVLLERFGLAGRDEEPVGGFSKGMRQKLAIVRTFLHQPRLVFLDEPTSGLDPQSARIVRDVIAELAADGCAVVLCSHNLAEVERLCTRVAVIKGRLRTVASLTQLRRAGLALDVQLVSNALALAEVVRALPFAPAVLQEGERLRVLLADEMQAPDVVSALVHAGGRVAFAARAARPLEEAYLELVRDEGEA
jgi:ABC-2 type transport system ATP-binding protein